MDIFNFILLGLPSIPVIALFDWVLFTWLIRPNTYEKQADGSFTQPSPHRWLIFSFMEITMFLAGIGYGAILLKS
jgi:hypothetical protein